MSEKHFGGWVTEANIGILPFGVVLYGILADDHKGRFKDGTPIRTSKIECLVWDTDEDFLAVETQNTVYYVREDLLKTQFGKNLGGNCPMYHDELLQLVISNKIPKSKEG